MKKQYIAVPVVFICFLLMLGLLTLILPEKPFSEQENRYLQEFSAPTASTVADGSFQEDFSDALRDQFPIRNQIMSFSTSLRRLFGLRESGGVYLGKEHYYFDKILDKDLHTERFSRNLKIINRYASVNGQNTRVMLVPDAGTLFDELLPAGAELYDADSLMRTAGDTLTVSLIDIRSALRQEGCKAFYKTDHHWTSRGAWVALTALLDGRSVPGDYDDAGFTTVTDSFLGTLYSKALDPAAQPDSIELLRLDGVTVTCDGKQGKLYSTDALSRKNKYEVFLDGNHGLVTITGGCQNENTLLVVRDSFASCLAPLLSRYYGKVLLVDPRYYGGSINDLVQEQEVDETLFVFELSSFADSEEFTKLVR